MANTYSLNAGSIEYGATSPVIFGITSVKYNPGALADIDKTTSLSTEREYARGFGEGESIEITTVMDDTLVTLANLEEWQADCNGDLFVWKLAKECDTSAAFITRTGRLFDFSIDSELDNAATVTMTWRLTAVS
tara:strand:- start:82 stop:483 length:402 start_codon:yes stop_codon:yes gene_type:complete